MTEMTVEQKGAYLEALAHERTGYEHSLAVARERLEQIPDGDAATPADVTARAHALEAVALYEQQIADVDAEIKRAKGAKARRAQGD